MYLSCGVPCSDCARGIINAGIVRIFCEKGGSASRGPKWEESAERSWEMFDEANVKVCFYDDEFAGI
jgi:deoxycytidylate deaminase